MTETLRMRAISGPALRLVAGRTVGFVAAFAIPVVLARVFDKSAFGTYKQLFLVFTTLYGLAQLGLAESLYYFIPRKPGEAGRRACNAIVTLAVVGMSCFALLRWGRNGIATWLANPELASGLPLIGLFLAFALTSAVFEIIMVSRKEHAKAAFVYAGSDVVRAALFVLPALAMWGLHGVLIGAVAFAGVRLAAMLVYVWREFGSGLRLDAALWRGQLGYALPFALAVGIEVVQANYHQYVVASHFDAATFAIYAVGCLQIPLVDLISTSTANVMMVRMAEEAAAGQSHDALTLWHDTTCQLATLMFPLAAVLLLTAHAIIVTLFTSAYAASVPIFMIWCLMILPSAFAVDAVLRVYAQTRFLLGMNILRLALIMLLIGWCLSTFGMVGAVLVTLFGTGVVKALGIVRIARVMNVGLADALPWGRLAAIALRTIAAAVPAYGISRGLTAGPLVLAIVTGAVYAAAFAALWYGSIWWQHTGGLAPFTALSESPTE